MTVPKYSDNIGDMEKMKESFQSIDQIRSHLDNVTNSLRLSDRLDIVIERGQIAIHLIAELSNQKSIQLQEVEERRKDVEELVLKRIQLILIRKVRTLIAMQSKAPTFKGKVFLLDRLIAELEESRNEIQVIIPDNNIEKIVHQIKEVRNTIWLMNEE